MSERIVATDGHKGHWYTGEEIVRCRDCKFCMAYMAGTYCDYMAHAIKLDGYCAWGKRRDA